MPKEARFVLTFHSITQTVAETMHKDDFILLAGDAAHVHSSGFAQGFNTAVHDATNLVWKLSGALKGWYQPGVLASYDSERRTAAERLIGIDRLAAAAVSGDIPAKYKAMGLTVDEVMRSIFEDSMTFTLGLGVSYDTSVLNVEPLATNLVAGTRSPDALVYTPGPAVPVRLHDITHRNSRGRWTLLIFAGRPHQTKQDFTALRQKLEEGETRLSQWSQMYQLATIMLGVTESAWKAFDGPAIGKLYFDKDAVAHGSYGVYPDNGAIAVIRPDGIFAFGASLKQLEKIENFFGAIFAKGQPKDGPSSPVRGVGNTGQPVKPRL